MLWDAPSTSVCRLPRMHADFPAPIRAIRENQRQTNEELDVYRVAIEYVGWAYTIQ